MNSGTNTYTTSSATAVRRHVSREVSRLKVCQDGGMFARNSNAEKRNSICQSIT